MSFSYRVPASYLTTPSVSQMSSVSHSIKCNYIFKKWEGEVRKSSCFAFYSVGEVLEIPHILLLLTVCLLFITGLLGLTKVIASSSFNLNLVKANYLLQTVGNILLPQKCINLQKAATKKCKTWRPLPPQCSTSPCMHCILMKYLMLQIPGQFE